MSEAIEQPGEAALPRPMGIGEILSMAFQLYRRHWGRLLAIAAVVVVPLTLLQHLLGDLEGTERETTSYGGVVTVTPTWLGAIRIDRRSSGRSMSRSSRGPRRSLKIVRQTCKSTIPSPGAFLQGSRG